MVSFSPTGDASMIEAKTEKDEVIACKLKLADVGPSVLTIASNGFKDNNGNPVQPTALTLKFTTTGSINPSGASVQGRIYDTTAGAWVPAANGGGPIAGTTTGNSWSITFNLQNITTTDNFYLKVDYLNDTDPAGLGTQIGFAL
jgi:hypothetical protein